MLDSEDDIRGLLTHATAPAPKVDLADVVAKWRRRRTRRRWAGTATAISLVLLVVATSLVVARATKHAAPAEPLSCTAARLPLPTGYNRGRYMNVDPTGRYILGQVYDTHDLDAVALHGTVQVMWTDGVPAMISIPGKVIDFFGLPNAQGVAMGLIRQLPSTQITVFRYQDGVVTDLHSPVPDTWEYNGGYVTDDGTIMTFAKPLAPDYRPWVTIEWAPGAIDGRTVKLLPFNSPTAELAGDHLIVTSFPPNIPPTLGNPETYITDLDGGHPYRLPSPPGTVAGIWGAGGEWASGSYVKPALDGEGHAVNVRWNLRNGSYKVVEHEGFINAKGWIVYEMPNRRGSRLDRSGTDETLAPPPGFSGHVDARGIADDGTIVGTASLTGGDPTGQGHDQVPVIWHC